MLLSSSKETLIPEAIYSIDNLTGFAQQNNHPTLFNPASIAQTSLNFFNTFLLYCTLFKKPKKPVKRFIKPISEIAEIEQCVMEALENNRFH